MIVTPEMIETAIAVATALGIFKGGEYGAKKYSERKNGNSGGNSNGDKFTENRHDKLCDLRLALVNKTMEDGFNMIESRLDHMERSLNGNN